MPEGASLSGGERDRLGLLLADQSLGATQFEAPADTILHEPDTTADQLFLIESGQVRLYQAGPDALTTRLVSILGPGDWLGLTGLGESSTYGMRAVAVSRVVVWRIGTEAVRRKLGELSPIASDLVVQMARKLKEAQEAAGQMVFNDCNQRLLATLVQFSGTAAATPGDEGEIILHITHQQLAQAVGAARETVSLALTQLRQRNLLRTGRNRLLFNPRTLREFAERSSLAAHGEQNASSPSSRRGDAE